MMRSMLPLKIMFTQDGMIDMDISPSYHGNKGLMFEINNGCENAVIHLDPGDTLALYHWLANHIMTAAR